MLAADILRKSTAALDLQITPYERKMMIELKNRSLAGGAGKSSVTIAPHERILLDRLFIRAKTEKVIHG